MYNFFNGWPCHYFFPKSYSSAASFINVKSFCTGVLYFVWFTCQDFLFNLEKIFNFSDKPVQYVKKTYCNEHFGMRKGRIPIIPILQTKLRLLKENNFIWLFFKTVYMIFYFNKYLYLFIYWYLHSLSSFENVMFSEVFLYILGHDILYSFLLQIFLIRHT